MQMWSFAGPKNVSECLTQMRKIFIYLEADKSVIEGFKSLKPQH